MKHRIKRIALVIATLSVFALFTLKGFKWEFQWHTGNGMSRMVTSLYSLRLSEGDPSKTPMSQSLEGLEELEESDNQEGVWVAVKNGPYWVSHVSYHADWIEIYFADMRNYLSFPESVGLLASLILRSIENEGEIAIVRKHVSRLHRQIISLGHFDLPQLEEAAELRRLWMISEKE